MRFGKYYRDAWGDPIELTAEDEARLGECGYVPSWMAKGQPPNPWPPRPAVWKRVLVAPGLLGLAVVSMRAIVWLGEVVNG